jgi:uncharacterized protein (TIGR02594 family)
MAERRVQVRELDVPSLSSVTPTASPVETYVRPEREQVQPSALSQFVSAITPAIKADSDERLRKTLEREQKIQDGRFKNQVNELGQYALQVGFNLKKDFEKNSEHYFSLRDDVDGTAAEKFLAVRQGYIDENVERLEQEGVDEILVQEFKNRMQEYNTEFLAKVYLPGREETQKKDRKNRFTTSLSIILETVQDRQDALEKINDAYLRHVDANWGNHAETLDTLWKYAEEISLYNADNALVDWLKSPQSSPEGQPAQWLVGKRAGQRATIESRILKQAEQNKKRVTKALTHQMLLASVEGNYETRGWGNIPIGREVPLPNGEVIKLDADKVAPYVDDRFVRLKQSIQENPNIDEDTKEARIAEISGSRLTFYSFHNRVPPEVSQTVGNASQYLAQGDIANYPERVQALEAMYKTLTEADAYTQGKISPIVLKGDDATRFKHLQALVKVGKDFQQAVGIIQGPLYEGRTIKLEDGELRSYLDNPAIVNLVWSSKAARANNLYVMAPEIKRVAEALLQTGGAVTPEEAKVMAMSLVGDDYQYITNTDGTVSAVRIESNALNNPVNIEQLEQGLVEIQNDPILSSFINNRLSVEGTTIRPSTFGAGGVEPGFDLFLRETGNPNQYYVMAKAAGEPEATTQSIIVNTVNLWDFNKNTIQGLKDQTLRNYYKAVEEGFIEPEVAVDTFYNLASVPPSNEAFVATVERAIGDNGVPYPPVRPEELGGGAPLTVPERRLSNAQIRQDERIQRSLDLNREALSEEVVTDEGSSSWIRSIGSAIGKAIFGGEAQSAELESTVAQSLDKAATNPLEFILNNRYLGLSEKDPDHQKTIAGFMNRAVKGRVKNPSDMQLDSNAWCAAFAGHVLSSLGIASPQRYDALRARSYLKVGRGISIDKAQPGDLVVMKTRLQNGKTQWHAGFFVEHDGGKTFKLLGGNQKDQVNVQNNTVANIAGIRRINNVQNIKPDALKAIQRDMTFFGKLQNFLAGYRAK